MQGAITTGRDRTTGGADADHTGAERAGEDRLGTGIQHGARIKGERAGVEVDAAAEVAGVAVQDQVIGADAVLGELTDAADSAEVAAVIHFHTGDPRQVNDAVGGTGEGNNRRLGRGVEVKDTAIADRPEDRRSGRVGEVSRTARADRHGIESGDGTRDGELAVIDRGQAGIGISRREENQLTRTGLGEALPYPGDTEAEGGGIIDRQGRGDTERKGHRRHDLTEVIERQTAVNRIGRVEGDVTADHDVIVDLDGRAVILQDAAVEVEHARTKGTCVAR